MAVVVYAALDLAAHQGAFAWVSMIMSLCCLSDQFRTRRFEQRATDRATITVRRAKPSADGRRFTGRVLVDRKTFGYLVGGESSSR